MKAGQKCTAIRRTLVPERHGRRRRSQALAKRLAGVKVGDPSRRRRAHGAARRPRAGDARSREQRRRSSRAPRSCVFGDPTSFDVVGADPEKGAFFPPTLLLLRRAVREHRAARHRGVRPGEHRHAVRDASTRPSSSRSSGKGSLVGSLFTADDDGRARGGARHRRRITAGCMVVNRHSAKESTGHGSPLPHLVHGGPGRAGGGEEMGGVRGVLHYMQRTALQGSPPTLTARRRASGAGAPRADGSRASLPEVFRGARDRRDAGHASSHGHRERRRELRRHHRRFLLRAHGRRRGARVAVRAARGARLLRALGRGRAVRRSRARARCSPTTGSRGCAS